MAGRFRAIEGYGVLTMSPDPAPALDPPATIVYVEDNAVNATLFEAVLALHPAWRLRIAVDGAAALALLCELTPDLLVIDAHLPDIHGVALLQQVRALHPVLAQVPAAMFSADARADHVAAARAAGFEAYWTKPMNVGEVVSSMRDLLSRRPRVDEVRAA